MNIFVTSLCPIESARNLDDRRVVKMLLESAQLLSTSLGGNPYKITHRRHPCTLWVSDHTSHAVWLYRHFIALSEEYTYRFSKTHRSYDACKHIFHAQWGLKLPPYPLHFMVCPPSAPMLPLMATRAYIQIMQAKWLKSPGRFTRRPPPPFYPPTSTPILLKQEDSNEPSPRLQPSPSQD